MKKDERKPTTTDAGIPVAGDEYSLTVGPDGPILLRAFEYWRNIDKEIGDRIARGVKGKK